jgi:F420-dependent oxidoreductase-like protein
MKIGLMVEGQVGLTWERWSHILALAERLGFPTLFRSDHYFIGLPQQDSLEPFLSFVMAAQNSKTLRFGPLVTPITFRTPVQIGRMAAQIDQLSGGRFVLGIGAGWHEAEHHAYGIPFPPIAERFERLQEALDVIKALWSPGSATYSGKYYTLEGADCLPKPASGRPPILIGGQGIRYTLPLVAKYADEWNSINAAPEWFAERVEVIERLCREAGRDPKSIKKSMMVFGLVGPNQQVIDKMTERVGRFVAAGERISLDEVRDRARARGMIVGSIDEVIDRLGRLAELGMEEVQFQHLFFDSDEVPEYIASEILPQASKL